MYLNDTESMTYIRNVWNALRGTPFIKVEFKEKRVEVIKHMHHKDPRGLIARDLDIIKRAADNKPYKEGDTLEKITRKVGQQDIIRFIEQKLIKTGIIQ